MTKLSDLARVVYKRTYSRADSGAREDWDDTVERVIFRTDKDRQIADLRARLEMLSGEIEAYCRSCHPLCGGDGARLERAIERALNGQAVE